MTEIPGFTQFRRGALRLLYFCYVAFTRGCLKYESKLGGTICANYDVPVAIFVGVDDV